MALTIKIGDDAPLEKAEAPLHPPVAIRLNIKKTVDGNIMIFDHPEIDIAIMPEKKKIIVFPKEKISDRVYDVQDRLFKFLGRKGTIVLSSIQGGNIYGSMQATYPESETTSPLQAVLLVTEKFIQEEEDYFRISDKMEADLEADLTAPDDQDSTELGEVPHSSQKGSIRPGYIYSPYGISSIYRYE